MPGHPEIVSTWADTGTVNIWNLNDHIAALDTPPAQRLSNRSPMQSFKGMFWRTMREERKGLLRFAGRFHFNG
jgi:hypothetical protein